MLLKRWKALLGAEASWFHWTRQMLAYDKTSMQQQLIKALMKTGARDKAEQIGLKGKASRQDSFKQKSDWRQTEGGRGFCCFWLQCFTSFRSEITAFYVLICIEAALLRSAANPLNFGTIFSLGPVHIYTGTFETVLFFNNWHGNFYSGRVT